jgi:hypothetical protein
LYFRTRICVLYLSHLFYFFFVFHIRNILWVLRLGACTRWCIFDFCQLLAQPCLWMEAKSRYELCCMRTNISKLSCLSLIVVIVIIVTNPRLTSVLYPNGYWHGVLLVKFAFI